MKRVFSLALSGALAVASAGCYSDPDTNTQIGTVTGGLIGAGLGAVVGAQTGDPGAGVAIGSVAGALAGGAVGNKIDAQEKRYVSNEERLQRQERELGTTRREIEGLRRNQDDSQGRNLQGQWRGGESEMRARPGRIVAKEDMSTSTRMRLAQMAAEGKVVDPFAGKNGSGVYLGSGDQEQLGEEQARAGLKLSKKSKSAAASKLASEHKRTGAKTDLSMSKLSKKRNEISAEKSSETVKAIKIEQGDKQIDEMVEEVTEASGDEATGDGASLDGAGVEAAGFNSESTVTSRNDIRAGDTEQNDGLVRPSSIFSPLPPSAVKTGEGVGGAARGSDSFRWGGDANGAEQARDDFRVGKDAVPDIKQESLKKLAKNGALKAGVAPALPGVNEETLGELLDKDQVEDRGDSKGGADSTREEIDLVKGDLNKATGKLAKAGTAAAEGADQIISDQQGVEAKLAKSRAEAANELARYGEESTLGDLSELEGDIDQLTKSGDEAATPQDQSPQKLVDAKVVDNKSPCGQAAADLKEGMAVAGHGDKLFHYRRAIRLCPTDPKYHNALGEFYLSLKRYDDARHEFKEALSVDPSYSSSQRNLKQLESLKAGG